LGEIIPGKGGETEGFILLDAWMERMGMPDLLTRVKRMWEHMRYGVEEHEPDILPAQGPKTPKDAGRAPDIIVIEEKGSGISLRQMLEREKVLTWPYNPGRAKKIERLHAVSHLPHAGRVWIPEGIRRDKVTGERIATGKFASWAEPMIGQVCAFYGEGSTEHDDYVDSASQAWRYLADWGRIEVTVPKRVEEKDSAAEREADSWYGE
jgi:phage terminase large subunit-like protein